MADVNASVGANAVKSVELLHRMLGYWLVLCLVAAYLPATKSGAQLKLPFTEVAVPVNTARWSCAIVIFLVGAVGCVMLKHLRDLCVFLSKTEEIAVVLTYPSVATVGTPRKRFIFGLALAGIQYSVGIQLWSPMPEMFGGRPDFGLAFLYAGPMVLFAWVLQDWQQGLTTDMGLPKITGAGK